MKKYFVFAFLCLMLCTACGEKAELIVPDPIEPSIEQIKKSNLETAKITFNNIKKTAELYFVELQLDSEFNHDMIRIDFSDSFTIPENFVFSGSMPTSGIVLIDENGRIILENIVINNLICNYNEVNEVDCK